MAKEEYSTDNNKRIILFMPFINLAVGILYGLFVSTIVTQLNNPILIVIIFSVVSALLFEFTNKINKQIPVKRIFPFLLLLLGATFYFLLLDAVIY
ncbi:hypothetical protein [Alkalihalobacterium elongatum]|uniref:hypothetical protein n=1 Tax=Alkalihalobacterium elongatum TaxID=2675466 RepID=UPI001C1FD9AA|nr:hypothetical protein [Alkalihalobacterium elongatum]